MIKRKGIIAILVFLMIFTTACGSNTKDTVSESQKKPVKVVAAVERPTPVVLEYIGTVMSDSNMKLSFKTSGNIAEIPVKKGQFVKKGDVIARLDKKDLEFSVMASKAQMEAARAQYEKGLNGARSEDVKNAELGLKKARDAYDFAEDTYKKMNELYKEAAISKFEFDKAKLELDIRESEMRQAKELVKQLSSGTRQEDRTTLLQTVEQANADYLHKKSLLEDGDMKAEADGYIADTFYKEGEYCPAGHPVALFRVKNQVVKVGLSIEDSRKISKGTKVVASVNQQESEGIVEEIDDIPDEQTRTYTAKVSLPEGGYTLGAVARISFILESRPAIWLPVSAVLSNGESFVYVIKDGIAEKRKIKILDTKGTEVRAEGIANGETLVVEGMKRLNNGDKIEIKG